ncbi:MAG TPA: folylpolyglutamate synthase/dihydrofolate synthase family protein, partial [Bacteroidota bacterium]|nr:folylpolyglutamate synthase/dihydrofolate synthase family protein [Bacteroidota bacterium]
GMKFGLSGIRSLLQTVGNPERTFPAIHVAGTNGKGSTCSMLAAILTAAGYKTGLYTSPHLISFTERIRIDGRPIPPREVTRLSAMLRRQVRRQQATFFEATTAIAFKYFADEHVDIAVVETGLGGRLDATNVLRPEISVVTNVSLEHTEILGKTLEKIAREKGGIIKPRTPCVTGVRERGPLGVLRSIARKKRATLIRNSGVKVTLKSASLAGLVVDVVVGRRRLKKVHAALNGDYQLRNLATVFQVLDLLNEQGRFPVREREIRRGLRNVSRLAGLQARLAVVHRKPLVLADVAHNPDAAKNLASALGALGVRNVLLVLGVVKDKDYRSIIHALRPVTRAVIITAARTPRSRPVADLWTACRKEGMNVVGTSRRVSNAMRFALLSVRRHEPIVVTGSHYVVGEALAYLRSRKFT